MDVVTVENAGTQSTRKHPKKRRPGCRLRSGIFIGATQKGLPVPLATRGFLAAPLECDCIYVTVFGLIVAIYVKFTLHNQLCTNTPTCQICF
jgi:hypothetical protein